MNEISAHLMRLDIYAVLRREILNCAIAPGAEIRDAEVAERFSVSRSPVRDALLRLEAEGLVVINPRKGYRAAPISIADARDLFEFRAILEPACAASVAVEASDEALGSLDRFRRMEGHASVESAPARAFVEYNRAFHLAIAGMCANRRVREATIDLVEQFDRLVTVSVSSEATGGREALIAEHCDIIDALQARDGRLAGRILARHAGRARKRVLAALSQTPIVP
ncbi:MAG: GntR family transcriptional regulator [Hyphomicrobiales bacterium]|nr:GntR family transcriptional regulator [Hyphomicrobiales bacterium]